MAIPDAPIASPRKRSRWPLFALVGAAAFLACVVVAVIASSNTGTPSASAGRATVTPAPTDAPAPTATPHSEPSGTAWTDFAAHISNVSTDVGTIFGQIQTDATNGDSTATAADDDVLKSTTTNELAWLKAHPAQPCYAAVYAKWQDAMAHFQRGATQEETAINANDAAGVTSAVSVMSVGNADALLIGKEIPTVTCP